MISQIQQKIYMLWSHVKQLHNDNDQRRPGK